MKLRCYLSSELKEYIVDFNCFFLISFGVKFVFLFVRFVPAVWNGVPMACHIVYNDLCLH